MQEQLGKERWISYRMEFLYGFLLNQEHPDIFCALVWQLNQFAWTFPWISCQKQQQQQKL